MSYQVLEHTADVGIEVQGGSLAELFAEAVAALCDTVTERSSVEPRQERRFALAGPAPDLLLVDFLGELLYRLDSAGELFSSCDVELSGDGPFELRALARGERFDAERHPLKVAVKAVTYHGLEVRRTGVGWRARVLFDI